MVSSSIHDGLREHSSRAAPLVPQPPTLLERILLPIWIRRRAQPIYRCTIDYFFISLIEDERLGNGRQFKKLCQVRRTASSRSCRLPQVRFHLRRVETLPCR